MDTLNVWSLEYEIWDLPYDLAQGGEAFDFAQDREPVERLVEPFVIWYLEFYNPNESYLLIDLEFAAKLPCL